MARARSSSPSAKTTESGVAAKLARLGLATDWDFLLHLPLRYVDETRVTPIDQLQGGEEAQVEGTIVASEISYRGRRQLTARLADDTAEVLLRFLHFYPSQAKSVAAGKRVRALGSVRGGTLGLEMVHPRVRAVDDTPLPTRLTPVYPAAAGISQQLLRGRIERALRDVLQARAATDTVADVLRGRFDLPPLAPTLRDLHQPLAGADEAQLALHQEPLWRRIRFDELLAQQLTLRATRARRAARRAPALAPHGDVQERLRAALPFSLTGAQQRVWREIEHDLAAGVPMHRLVQGDVGSGKTVVAALAAARAIDAGYQAALMAPTEILAEQHFGRIGEWLAPLGVHVVWLTGRLKASEKKKAHAAIAQGVAQLVVGTHALVQDTVKFARLGLAIVDEQHRFGVAQRLALRDAAVAPHLLMLSATPIPRTLAMSYLADVDVSVIDELPPGRRPVTTKLVSTARREEVITRIRSEVQAGRQVYWVCPLVDESEKLEPGLELTAATTMYEQTRALLPDLRLGLLHGQLPASEKTPVMQAFVAGRIDVLVATTVIEVGVDVANASLMVIDHAQRFGLAQLHQLRGRVGRGAAQSYCVLLFDEPLSEAARERLKVIFEITDGFEVARRDLLLRGPGEFLGARQAGVPLLRFADLERDKSLVDFARDAATVLLHEYPDLAAEHVRRWLGPRATMLDA